MSIGGNVRTSGEMSSRERLLGALNFGQTDHVPCCFMGWSALREKCADEAEYLDRLLEMGLDAVVRIPEMAVRYVPEVTTREWLEATPTGEPYPILHKEYRTPVGTLTTAVNKSDEWPHGDHVPLWDDYLISHARKFLVTPDDSLDALRCILGPPTEEDIVAFRERAVQAKRLADERGLMLTAAYVMMGDMANWLAGIQEVMMATLDSPEFVHELLGVIEEWNRPFIELALEAGADLIIRRGWYENADFWSPPMHREFLLPSLKRQTEMVHRAGAKFGYLVSCSSMPLLDMMTEAGVDVLLGIDPAQDHTMDLDELKRKTSGKISGPSMDLPKSMGVGGTACEGGLGESALSPKGSQGENAMDKSVCARHRGEAPVECGPTTGTLSHDKPGSGRMALWGGVCGYLTVECGTPDDIRREVRQAITTLAPGSGFILAPVTNIRARTDQAWRNVRTLIDAWREMREYPVVSGNA